jgi:hypothetical protein
MGSRSTKVEQAPHVEAAASTKAPAENQHSNTNGSNENRPCQDNFHWAARKIVAVSQPCDDVSLTFPTQPAPTTRRRYSEPPHAAVMATLLNSDGVRHLAAFEVFLAERGMMSIDVDYASHVDPISHEQRPSVTVTNEEKEPDYSEVQCLVCCSPLPSEKDPRHVREVIKPCRSCSSTYCIPCVKNIFLAACKDSTRMPPRCCTQFHLHHIKAHLTAEEIAEYRSKYEEWNTKEPFYCPTPSCSAFIPERLLPQGARAEGRRKVDSGVGIFTPPEFECPQCEASICIDCRQLSHPNSLCIKLDFGVDPATAALLKAWGYKRCPKCGQGLKRMYGCSHMECRCGAHFCWGCLRNKDVCEGSCNDDDGEEYAGDMPEPDEPEPFHETGVDDTGELQTATAGSMEIITADSATEAQTASRPRNLDGGSSEYWMHQDLDFGDEPTEDIQDRVWGCSHSFDPYTISLTESLLGAPSTHGMECVKCWCMMRPNIETPPESKASSETPKTPRLTPRRGRGGHRRRDRGAVAQLRPATYVPPRGLDRMDATVGTAPHLTVQARSGGSSPRYEHSDIEPKMTITRTGNVDEVYAKHEANAPVTTSASNVSGIPFTTLSVAYECGWCHLLICEKCKDSEEAELEAQAAATEVEDAPE